MTPFDTFNRTIPLVLGLALAGCGGGSSDDPDDELTDDETPSEVSLTCDQTLDFQTNGAGVDGGATAEYEGLRYVALDDELCEIDTEAGTASTAMPLEGVEDMLEPVLTVYDVEASDGSDRVEAVVFPSGSQIYKANAGRSDEGTSAFSSESQAADIDAFRGTFDMSEPESTPLTYRVRDDVRWSAVNLDDPEAGGDAAPRDFPDGYEPLGPIHNNFAETTGWIVRDDDGELAAVDVGDEAEEAQYRQQGDTKPGSTSAVYITALDAELEGSDSDPLAILRVGADAFVAYDPEEDEFADLGSVDGSLSDLSASYATDGENVFVAYTDDDEAVLYRISAVDDAVEEIDSAGTGETAPGFVVATDDRVVWGWNPTDGEDDGSQVVSMEANGDNQYEILDTTPGGTGTGHVVTSEVPGPAGDTVFFNETNVSPEFGGEGSGDPAFKAHAADAATETDPVLETYEDAQWQGASAESVVDKRRGVVSDWSLSEIFMSKRNEDGDSELHVVPGDAPSDNTYLGELSPTLSTTDSDEDLDEFAGPQFVEMRNFGLGPYRLMMVGSDLVMVDTRHENSMITLAVEDPEDPSISLFRGF